MDIGYKKRVIREKIYSTVAQMMIRDSSNFENRIKLRQLTHNRDWAAVKILSRIMGVEVHGDPNKFKSVILEKVVQVGCKTIW